MRVALLHARLGGPASGGGGPRIMLWLALALRDLGHDACIVCHDLKPGTEFANASRELEVRTVRSGPFQVPQGKWAVLRQFYGDMRRVAALVPEDTQVISAHEWPALHAARLAGDRLDIPFVWVRSDHTIFERAVLPGERSEVSTNLIKRIPRAIGSFADLLDARRAAEIVTIDERSRRMAERAYRRSARAVQQGPSEHFFSPPDRASCRRSLGVGDDEFMVLGVGIMAPHRRFEDLIDAVALTDAGRLRVRIIGSDHTDPAYAEFVERRIAERGVGDRVSLQCDAVSDEELHAAYAAADLFAFPSDHRQSWGLAPLEALATGTPVLITTDAGVHEILAGRPGVAVVPPRSPAAIVDVIRDHLAASGHREVEPTRGWLRAEMSMRRYAERMVEIYAEAIAGRSTNGDRRRDRRSSG